MQSPDNDRKWLQRALSLAKLGQTRGEVPVGAVLVLNDDVIGEGTNQPISCCDPTAHAEVVALRQGAQNLDNYRLPGSTLYVTLEPCAMCVGAIVHARIERLVFGAYDPKAGAVVSQIKLLEALFFNHHVAVTGGILAHECGILLTEFFRKKRQNKIGSDG